MKKLLLAVFCLSFYFTADAQCSLLEIPLTQRAAASSLIVEGKVISRNSFWNTTNNMIYTSSEVEVYKIFKGTLATSTIHIISEGGIVGMTKITANPALNLQVNEVGVFTCAPVTHMRNLPANMSGIPQFEAFASVQGFIKYDLNTGIAADAFHTYTHVEAEIYPVVLEASRSTYTEIQSFELQTSAALHNGPNPTPQAVSGISPTTITAGTGAVLTITGTAFGATQGAGVVRFRNADDGGATFITPLASQYLSWSNTQITVEVPSNAGTGAIQVIQGPTFTSAQTLTISYAHLNVDFDPGPGTIAYQTDHIDDNGSGGYTWRMNTAFDAATAERASFMRAFDSWRCATGINWAIGATTSVNDAVSDGTNVICNDNAAPLSAGILGVCYSYWSGCASGPTIVWYVNELDIIFDDGSNISPLTWEYGPATPSGSEYDFETVAVHELGHGHQLGHVINNGAIMHYAISNGTFNRSLGATDLAGGNFVQAKSVVSNICGPGAMSAFSCASPPVANFSASPTTICAGTVVPFTDLSTNTPTSWSWTFPGGTPSSSTAQNPVITYATPGTYNVSLTATNASGSDPEVRNGYITVLSVPAAPGSVSPVSCFGGNDGAINLSPTGNGPFVFSWSPSGQTTEDRTGLVSGIYTVTVIDNNGCSVQNSFPVNQPASAVSATMSKTDATCANNNGTATATPSGGTAPYTYVWSPGGQTTQVATALAAGSYTCTVTDFHGCSFAGNITVNMNCGTTRLTNATCGITLSSLSQQVFCVAVPNATNYRYRWTNAAQGFSFVFVRNSSQTNCYGSWITGIQYGRTYNVEVSAFVGSTWSAYGTICTVTTPPAVPVTQLIPSDCGTTVATMSELIYATAVTGATQYEWRLSNAPTLFSTTYVRVANTADLRLQWVSGVQYGITYDVEVRAYVGGVWGNFGAVCTVTTPAFPTTQLTAASCNSTLAAVSTPIYCTAVTGATNYQWKVENAALGYSSTLNRGNNQTNWYLSTNGGILVNTTYTVTVRAYVGGVWGTFGPACTVTTGPVQTAQVQDPQAARTQQEICTANPGLCAASPELTMEVYPNPFAENITVITDASVKSVAVYNSFGEFIRTIDLQNGKAEITLSDFADGIYLIQARTESGVITKTVIKQH